MAQACAPAAPHTIGDDPEPPRVGVDPAGGRQGGRRGLASWSGHRSLCDDGRTMSSTPTLDAPAAGRPGLPGGARTLPARDPRHPGPRDRRRRRRPGRAPRRCPCCGCGRRSWSRPRSAARRRDVRRALDGAAHRRAVRRERARPRERQPARARGRGAYAGWSTPARRSRWARSASAWSCCSQGAARRGRRVLAAADRDRRHRAAVAAGRRGAARALGRHHRPDRPGADGLRLRRLGGRTPGSSPARC